MERLSVIKIGGNVIDSEAALQQFISDFAAIPGYKILVHGGGKLATDLSRQLGIETKMTNGRRITDEATMRVVTMTYAGFVNKNIVARLIATGCKSIGLCGADAHLLPAVKRPVKEIDYGFVGDLDAGKVNIELLQTLLDKGLTPVIAPITCDNSGQLLNVNADTVARSLAVALSSIFDAQLVYCFEKKGVLCDVADESSLIPAITRQTAELMKCDGVISQGMAPKIDNALGALQSGVGRVIIGAAADVLLLTQNKQGYGTHITA